MVRILGVCALVLISLAIPTAPAPTLLRNDGDRIFKALPSAHCGSLARSRLPCPNPVLPLLVGLRGGGGLSGDEQAEGSEMDEMRGEKPGMEGAEDDARAWQPWAMTDRDPPRRRVMVEDGNVNEAVVHGKRNTASMAAVKLADAQPGQEILVEEEAWLDLVEVPPGSDIRGVPTAKGSDPKMQGKWLVVDGGRGGMQSLDMTVDAPVSEGRDERSDEYMKDVVLLEVAGGAWDVRNCSVSCRHGVCVRSGSDSDMDFDVCSMGGVYDMHYWREQYQFRINEVQVCMNADDIDAEMGRLEEDVIVAGGCVAAVWARGKSRVRINNTWLQYACMPPHNVIRNDRNESLVHKAPGWEDDDPRMAKYYVKLAEVVLAHNSSKKKIPFEKLPLLPRPHKGEPFDCATAVFLQDAARCNITSCIFKRNNVGVSVDDRTHVLVENCTVLSGYYGFVDAVEWGVPKPLMEPSDTGATVELAGNKVRGRLWASANMPKVTRVLRRNVVEPTSMRPDFRMDLEFEDDRLAMQNKQAELDQQMKEVEGMSTPSDWGDTDEGAGDYAAWPYERVIGEEKRGLKIDWGEDKTNALDDEDEEYSREKVEDYRKPIDPMNMDIDVFPGVLASMGFNNSVIDMFYEKQETVEDPEDANERNLTDEEADARAMRGEFFSSGDAPELVNSEYDTETSGV